VQFAFWDARFVGIETDFGSGKPFELSVVKLVNRNAQAIDLHEGDLPPFERIGDSLTLSEKPIRFTYFTQKTFLQRCSALSLDRAEAAGHSAN
jgi:hypothetical protein